MSDSRAPSEGIWRKIRRWLLGMDSSPSDTFDRLRALEDDVARIKWQLQVKRQRSRQSSTDLTEEH